MANISAETDYPVPYSALFLTAQKTANDKQVGGTYPTKCIIQLSKGYVTYVDKETFEDFGHFKWSVLETGNQKYAVRMENDKYIYLHRCIMNPKDDEFVDHIDGNGLNNLRTNLRIATKSQNLHNIYRPRGISKYKGVWYKPNRKNPWVAEIKVANVKIRLGHFATEKDAAIAYNECAEKLLGSFARINNVSE